MIIVLAQEEIWKYDDSYFYYPVCLPTLKLLEFLSNNINKKVLFKTNEHNSSLIEKLIKDHSISLNFDFDLTNKELDSKNHIVIDFNSPLLYYKREEILSNKGKIKRSKEYIFKIKELSSFKKLFDEIQKKSLKIKDNVILGNNIFICPLTEIGKHNVIMDNTFLIRTKVKDRNKIGPFCYIVDSEIGNDNKILFSVIRKNQLMSLNTIGPFSHLRENNVIENSKIGAFVECKNIRAEGNLKASHLAYLGDLIIEKNVNIGAGVVFANYDGKNKYTSIIKENSFIGSNSVIISPKTIGPNSYVGAGSVVTKDVPPETIVIGNPARVYKKNETAAK